MVESKFKNTDIGQIPEDWDLVYWNDIFDFKSTASYSRAEIKPNGDIGYIHYGDIHTKIKATLDINKFVSGYISNKQLKTYTSIKKGDLIMADASEDLSGIGKSFEVIEPPKNNVISGLHTFLIREKNNGFLANGFKGYFHFNPLIKKQYNSLATGLKVYSLSKGSFQHIQIPLPSLAEQNEIAKVLNDTDTWIYSLENLIAKKRQIKQGTLRILFTPNENWEEFDFNKKVWFQEGPGLRDWQFTKSGIKVINVTNLENGYLNLSRTSRHISLKEFEKMYKHFLIDDKDIVVASSGNSYGKVSVVRKNDLPLLMNTSVIRFKVLNGLDYLFLLTFLKSKFFKDQIDLLITGGAQPNFGPVHLNKIKIWIPKDVEEQNRIATILYDMDAEIENLEIKLAKSKQLKQGMIQQLLTGKIRLKESKEKEIIPIKKHNDHFNDAVLIGALASCFASEQYPMTRFKYTKVSYLLKRYKEEQTTGYLKKAAGPYKPETRYGGAEKIAIINKYVATKKSVYKGKQYEGFVNSTNIQEAIDYFKKWYSEDALQWISRFKFETNDNLELWATVDMAIQDLKNEDKPINLVAVKEVIKNDKEWKDKLKRTIFSDDNIKNAIVRLETLYT